MVINKKYIIKRDGRKKEFSKDKIIDAIRKTCMDVDGEFSSYMQEKAEKIAAYIENVASDKELGIEDIQDLVVKGLMNTSRADIAASYIEYRQMRTLNRGNTTDKVIGEVILGSNEDVNTENSNKNIILASTQRDAIAGEVSRDITNRILLPKKISKAHEEGIIHFHDSDYFLQNALTNCELVDLEDMLQNGTVVNGKLIEKPHRFLTACTIATQIILGVSSSTYGGCTITLSHLAPFVRDSYNKFYNKYINKGIPEDTAKELAEDDRKQEIVDGVQTFNYQINTMANTNGQAPFLSVCMYLGEVDEEYRDDLADIIEEFLNQRLKGIKNEQGVYITPAFPKLLYFLEEDNMCIKGKPGKYYYLTELAAKTTAKRMNPDYISVKKMKELKIDENGEGQAFPCMGCVDGYEVVTYQYKGKLYVEGFKRMWNRLSSDFEVKHQFEDIENPNLYMDLDGVSIYDTKEGFVETKRIIRNVSSNWVRVKIGTGIDTRVIECTDDHPFATSRGRVYARDLEDVDELIISNWQFTDSSKGNKEWDNYTALFYGRENTGVKNEIFSMGYNSRLYYLVGNIGLDTTPENNKTISFTYNNKETALQILALIRSLGMNCGIKENDEVSIKENGGNLKYTVTCEPSHDLKEILTTRNYRKVYENWHTSEAIGYEEYKCIDSVEYIDKIDYSYDVTTESDHFEVSGIYSHNCRSFLSTYVAKASRVIKGDEANEFKLVLDDVGYTKKDNILYPNDTIKVKAKIINGKIKDCKVRSIEVLDDGYKLNVDTPLYYGRLTT